MNAEVKDLIHDLRGKLEQVNTYFQCIIFDLKEEKLPSELDVVDLRKSLDLFNKHFDSLIKNLGDKK